MLDSESINHTSFIKKNNNWYNYIALTSFQPTKLYSFQNSGSIFLNFTQIWASMLFINILLYERRVCVRRNNMTRYSEQEGVPFQYNMIP